MKSLYPNFNFDQWLEQYYLTYTFFSYKNIDLDLMESELDNLEQMKTNFYNQTHLETEDIWCAGCQYLNILQGFNKFCAILSQKDWKTEEIVGHFLTLRYPTHKRIKGIVKALVTTGVKEYVSVDEYKNIVTFKKYMVKNIEKLLTELEIK